LCGIGAVRTKEREEHPTIIHTIEVHQHRVLLLPASVFRSELLELPADRFRIGFGRLSFGAGLEALERALA